LQWELEVRKSSSGLNQAKTATATNQLPLLSDKRKGLRTDDIHPIKTATTNSTTANYF